MRKVGAMFGRNGVIAAVLAAAGLCACVARGADVNIAIDHTQTFQTMDGFGASAPGGGLFEKFGFTVANVAEAVRRVIG